MLSRIAGHPFWMARYTERAEKPCMAGLSVQHRLRAMHARGSLPSLRKDVIC